MKKKPTKSPKKTAAKTPKQKPLSARSKALVKKGQQYFCANYKPREMVLDHGKGAKLYDLEGNDYIDLGSGIAVNGLGHQNGALLKALNKQSKKLWHTSNIFFSEPSIVLAEALVKATPFAKKVFFCNSGAEANEAAIKLVRKYAYLNHPPEKREIITFAGSFHGRTLATVTATAQPKYQEGFGPMPGGFTYVAFNDFEAIEKAITKNTCAVMVEPLQGEGGITPAAPGFLAHLRKLCDKVDALLVFDEIQCGMGRTSKLWCFAHDKVQPDVLTAAKALGGGLPIGAMLVGEKAKDVFQFGSHGSTFGGNPVVCAVAKASLDAIQSKALMKNVADRSKELFAGLHAINKEFGCFKELRGRGLMVGAELVEKYHGKAGDISEACRLQGVLVLQAGPNVLRLLPPLTITSAEVKAGLKRMHTAMQEFYKLNS